MKYNLNFDKKKLIVNTNKARGDPNYFPEVIFENCILVSVLDTDLQNSRVDRLNTIIYPEGCQNLNAPETVFLQADFRHQKYDNAGYVYDLKLSEDKQQILASFKIGRQNTLIDKSKKEWGSSYASAWMSVAEFEAGKSENIQEGKTYKDFIPENIYKEFFEGKTILPLTGLSVELDWTEDPQTDNVGVAHIKKYSIVRVSLLINDKAGQPQSRLGINNYKLRMTIDEKSQFINSMLENIDILDSKSLSKIRSADLLDQAEIWEAVKQRACMMCEAEAKRKADEEALNAPKTRSEADVITLIEALSKQVTDLATQIADMQKEDLQEETPVAEDQVPAMADVPTTRTAKETNQPTKKLYKFN